MSDEATVAEVETELKVEREQMERIFLKAGFKSCGGWNNKQMAERSSQLTEEDLDKQVSEGDKEMLDKVISANAKETKREIVVEGEKKKFIKATERNSTFTKETGVTTATAEMVDSEVTETKAPKDQKVSKRDRFGGHLGSIPSRINMALAASTEPCTPESLAAELGLEPKRVLEHLNYWNTKGKDKGVGKVLEKVEDKWRLNG